ncbi:MAG TPA: hypothetical protein VKZ59_04585, partial [Acidobacteriota bacterium]|nr:hypothetical protein [Acidobacteriota bacterium]
MLPPGSFRIFRITALSLAVGLLWPVAADGAEAARWAPQGHVAEEIARLLEEGRTDEARELLETLPDEKRNSYEAHHLYGLLALAEKDFEKAKTHFVHALEKQPKAFVTAFNLTLLYRAGGEFNKGLELMSPFLSSPELTDRQKAEAHELTASLYELSGSPRQAAEHLYAALQLCPEEERYYYSLGAHLLGHLAFA